jgi:hypothetical protein
MLVAIGPTNCARVRLPLPTHSAPAPAARSVGTPPEPNVLTVRVRSSTRVIVWSSALSTHAAPSPTATLVGVPPTSNVARSFPVAASRSTSELAGGRVAEPGGASSPPSATTAATATSAQAASAAAAMRRR